MRGRVEADIIHRAEPTVNLNLTIDSGEGA
jgi:hypothetical protein